MIQQKSTESCEDDDRQTVVSEISDLSPAHSVIMMKINQDPKPHLKLSMWTSDSRCVDNWQISDQTDGVSSCSPAGWRMYISLPAGRMNAVWYVPTFPSGFMSCLQAPGSGLMKILKKSERVWSRVESVVLWFIRFMEIRVYFMFTAHYTVYVEALQVRTWHHNELVHIITQSWVVVSSVTVQTSCSPPRLTDSRVPPSLITTDGLGAESWWTESR